MLKKKTVFSQQRDATELEAGRLAKELEKAQIHLAKHQEAAESTRIEFERMSAELSRVMEKLEKNEGEKEHLKQAVKMFEQSHNQQSHNEKQFSNIQADLHQLSVERYGWNLFRLLTIIFHFIGIN